MQGKPSKLCPSPTATIRHHLEQGTASVLLGVLGMRWLRGQAWEQGAVPELLEDTTSYMADSCHCFSLLADLHPRWTTHTPSLAGSDSPEPITRDPFNTEGMATTLADIVTTVMGSSQPVVSRGTADNRIPVYCSILAAVVVGLVAYIAFKR